MCNKSTETVIFVFLALVVQYYFFVIYVALDQNFFYNSCKNDLNISISISITTGDW